MRFLLLILCPALVLTACQGDSGTEELPVLGTGPIQDFTFIDQRGDTVTPSTFDDHIYVADFFFTSCPSICPIMTANMLEVHDAFADEDRLLFLSHSIDPARDTVETLRRYAEKLGVTADRWHFVTGAEAAIYDMAENYMVTAMPDEAAPGGFAHSGHFILVDDERRIRGVYDGTEDSDVAELMDDIPVLLQEFDGE